MWCVNTLNYLYDYARAQVCVRARAQQENGWDREVPNLETRSSARKGQVGKNILKSSTACCSARSSRRHKGQQPKMADRKEKGKPRHNREKAHHTNQSTSHTHTTIIYAQVGMFCVVVVWQAAKCHRHAMWCVVCVKRTPNNARAVWGASEGSKAGAQCRAQCRRRGVGRGQRPANHRHHRVQPGETTAKGTLERKKWQKRMPGNQRYKITIRPT